MTLVSFQKEYFYITFYFLFLEKLKKFPKMDIPYQSSSFLVSSSHIMGTAIDVLVFFPFIPSSKFLQNYVPHHVLFGSYLDLPDGNKNEDTGIVFSSIWRSYFT